MISQQVDKRTGRGQHMQSRARIQNLLLFYALGGMAGIIIFIALFRLHALSSIHILFYRGLALVALASILHALLMIGCAKRLGARPAWRGLGLHVPVVAMAVLCFNLIFFTFVPFNLERSISVFMLGYMYQHAGAPVSSDAMRDAFVKLYVDRYGAMDRRLDEQVASRDVVLTPDGYVLTEQGKRMVGFFGVIADIFGIDPRFMRSQPAANAAAGSGRSQ